MELSLEKRYEIVFLREHAAGPKWSFGKIAKHVHCSKPTVIYWVKKYHENPDLSTSERPGRPREARQVNCRNGREGTQYNSH